MRLLRRWGPRSRPGIDRLSIDWRKGFLQRIEVGLAGCLAGEVGQQSLEHELAAAEHGRLVAEPTYVGHVVRNEDRRLALGLAAENNFVEQLAGRQIHAFGRLVEHQQLGIVDQGLSQGQALEHALAVGGDGLAGAIGQADLVQEQRDPRRQVPPRQQGKGAVVCKESPGRQVPRKGRALVQVAHSGQRAAMGQRTAQSQDRSRGWTADRQQHLDERRLAGAVGAQQAEDATAADFEAHVAEGVDRAAQAPGNPGRQAGAVGLADVLEFNDRSCHGGTSLR